MLREVGPWVVCIPRSAGVVVDCLSHAIVPLAVRPVVDRRASREADLCCGCELQSSEK